MSDNSIYRTAIEADITHDSAMAAIDEFLAELNRMIPELGYEGSAEKIIRLKRMATQRDEDSFQPKEVLLFLNPPGRAAPWAFVVIYFGQRKVDGISMVRAEANRSNFVNQPPYYNLALFSAALRETIKPAKVTDGTFDGFLPRQGEDIKAFESESEYRDKMERLMWELSAPKPVEKSVPAPQPESSRKGLWGTFTSFLGW